MAQTPLKPFRVAETQITQYIECLSDDGMGGRSISCITCGLQDSAAVPGLLTGSVALRSLLIQGIERNMERLDPPHSIAARYIKHAQARDRSNGS